MWYLLMTWLFSFFFLFFLDSTSCGRLSSGLTACSLTFVFWKHYNLSSCSSLAVGNFSLASFPAWFYSLLCLFSALLIVVLSFVASLSSGHYFFTYLVWIFIIKALSFLTDPILNISYFQAKPKVLQNFCRFFDRLAGELWLMGVSRKQGQKRRSHITSLT